MPGHCFSASVQESHAAHSIVNFYGDQMYSCVQWGREESREWLTEGRWYFSLFLTEAYGLFGPGLFIISSHFTHRLFSCFEASCLYFTDFLEAMARAVLEMLQWEPVSQLRRSDIKFLVYLGSWAHSIQPSQAAACKLGWPAETNPASSSPVVQMADGDIG